MHKGIAKLPLPAKKKKAKRKNGVTADDDAWSLYKWMTPSNGCIRYKSYNINMVIYHPENFIHYVYDTDHSIWIFESCKCQEASSESAKKKLKENGPFRYFCTFIKLPGRLFVVQNVFDQMHKPQASQGHFCQPSVKSCHEQPIAQLKQLHLLCPVSLHHLFLQQDSHNIVM